MRGCRARVPGPSGATTPLGWTQEGHEASARSPYRCGHIEYHHFLGEYRRCSYRCRRDGTHIRTWTNHQSEIARDQDVGLPPSFRSDTFQYLEEEQAKLQHILGEFAGEGNVSSRTLAESSMVHFVQSIIDIGISLGRVSPIVTSESLLPSISAKKATKMIRLSGEAQGAEILSEYQGERFVNLICDAGTVQSLHTLYALVTNPCSETARFVANMIGSIGFSGDDYASCLKAHSFRSSRMNLLFAESSLAIWRLNRWDCVGLSSCPRIEQCEQSLISHAFAIRSV
jgi:hypothetical protein